MLLRAGRDGDMRIEVKTRPLWPLAAAVIAALAIWLWAAQGAG